MKLRAFLFLLLSAFVVTAAEPGKTKVLLITGGHGFEREPFLKVFSDNPNITVTHAEHTKGTADAYNRPDLYDYDAIVLYDMVKKLTDAQQARFKGLFERGIGLVVTHHAIVSYQHWPEYERIIGGLYPEADGKEGVVTEQAGYQHDVDYVAKIVNKNHPITAGLTDFPINDEIYWGYRTGKDITPLVSTDLPKSAKPLVWTRNEGKSKVVYVQLGHGPRAFENPNYRKLIWQSIDYVKRK